MRIALCLPVVLLACTASAWGADAGFYLTSGGRIVSYGDSITEQRLYTDVVETYVTTRYPNLDVAFINSGWGGDTVSGGFGGAIGLRLDRDVIAHHPTVMTIMLGMNDGGYRAESQANDEKLFRGLGAHR